MKNLSGFSIPPDGEVALCEVDGRLHSMKQDYANINAFTNAIDKHPRVHITRDMLHSLTSGDESRALFLPVHEPFLKQVAQLWYEQGFTEVLHLLATEQKNNPKIITLAAKWALKIIGVFSRIQDAVQPSAYLDKKMLLSSFAQTRNWCSSPIRYIAWHPHCTKLAVAASDDSIRIYSSDSTLVPILKSKLQRNVSCVSWRPLSASEIAVGCETCILIWTVDPNSVVTRPSTANSCVLRRINHCPVISLSWSPRGEYLVSASPADSALLVWDVALDQTSTLKRAGHVGNTFLSWSQDGEKLLAASSSLVFRVWNCKDWNAERWNTVIGRVQSACWSASGSILLFVTSAETILYSLCFKSETPIFTKDTVNLPHAATPLIDLSRMELPNGSLVGGLVQTIDWDPRGRHLAILFKDSDYVAVFMTTCIPVLQISPSCLLCGLPGETPSAISFQKNFAEGSCLSIAWSSGRLQHFPLIYSDLGVQTSPLTPPKSFDTSYNAYLSF